MIMTPKGKTKNSKKKKGRPAKRMRNQIPRKILKARTTSILRKRKQNCHPKIKKTEGFPKKVAKVLVLIKMEKTNDLSVKLKRGIFLRW